MVVLRTRPGICSRKTFIPFVTCGLFVGGLKLSTSGSFFLFTITNDRRQISLQILNRFPFSNAPKVYTVYCWTHIAAVITLCGDLTIATHKGSLPTGGTRWIHKCRCISNVFNSHATSYNAPMLPQWKAKNNRGWWRTKKQLHTCIIIGREGWYRMRIQKPRQA